jgi:glycosyltransferase involved in cell wall biosynthesis
MKQANTLIVPDIQIGRELVELYDIGEDAIEIIPYLPLAELQDAPPLQVIQTQDPYFIYDGGYGNEANILTLLAAWERYCHDGGNYELLLLGSAGDHLSTLTQTIRSLDIHTSVRYLGALDEGAMHRLYTSAEWWIYTWPYYSAWVTIELAVAYKLPMLLSDIVAFRNYVGLKIHPNHTLDIARALSRLETAEYALSQPHHEHAYIEAYEKILSKKK